MSYENNAVYVNSVRVRDAAELPSRSVVVFSDDSIQNEVRLQDFGGSGVIVIDMAGAAGCHFSMGSGNTIREGELRVHFPPKEVGADGGSCVDIGHLNTFRGSINIEAPRTPGSAVTIGSRNVVGQGLSVTRSAHVILDRYTGELLNGASEPSVGSRSVLGESVRLRGGGRVGNDAVVDEAASVDQDLGHEDGVLISGLPARVVRKGVAWLPRASASGAPTSTPAPLLTIAITTYERPRSLQRALDGILAQDVPVGNKVEILVIDDCSTSLPFQSHWENWGAISYPTGFDVTLLRNARPSRGPSAGRNTAIDVARAPYLMYLDDDDQLAEGALAGILGFLSTSDAQRVSLRYRKGERSTFLAPAIKHRDLGIADSLWSMITNSIWDVAHLRNTGSRFPSDVRYGEDSELCLYYSMRSERFAALSDRDYLIFGDAVEGEAAHLSQGREGWESFLRGVLAHLQRFSIILCESDLPRYAMYELAAKCILGRGLRSYQLVRRIAELADDELANELLVEYSRIVNRSMSRDVAERFARAHDLLEEVDAVREASLTALRDCKSASRIR